MTDNEALEKLPTYDAIVVGAGFAGLYALHRLRSSGYKVRVLEAGEDIGGTWFWNRYPGARCDIESMQYSYSFSDEIQQEWNWTQLYAPQPEILRYINFVADKLDLRRDVQLDTCVTAAMFCEGEKRWSVETQHGVSFLTRFLIMATGCLSIPLEPNLPGLNEFTGLVCRTSDWPRQGVELEGKRVGLIGTGSSGIQVAPILAQEARQLTVFQRTPNYSIPAHNRLLDPDYVRDWKKNYPVRRRAARQTRNSTLNDAGVQPGRECTKEERDQEFERRWTVTGGIGFMYAFPDMTTDGEINEHASEFVRARIASIVRDPATAKTLTPKDYGIGGKRICVDTNYYETFNRDNVALVDIKKDSIVRVIPDGLLTASRGYEFDILVLAVGFDAMTGALRRIDITGRAGAKLRDHWDEAPKTYLGLSVAGFPNMFTITGPGSPSVFANMVTSVEQHADWIVDCINSMRRGHQLTI
jgi:cyclohexanone monooxygenase